MDVHDLRKRTDPDNTSVFSREKPRIFGLEIASHLATLEVGGAA
jgi:hypothetical protein